MSRSRRSIATEFVIVTLGVALALAADSAVELRAVVEDRAEIQDSVRFVDDLTLLMGYLTFDANTAAIEALKNSGRIDLISNGELREALLDYVNGVENTAEADAARRQAILGYSERLLPRLVEGSEWSGRWRSEADRRSWAAGALNSRVMRESGALRELLLRSCLSET